VKLIGKFIASGGRLITHSKAGKLFDNPLSKVHVISLDGGGEFDLSSFTIGTLHELPAIPIQAEIDCTLKDGYVTVNSITVSPAVF